MVLGLLSRSEGIARRPPLADAQAKPSRASTAVRARRAPALRRASGAMRRAAEDHAATAHVSQKHGRARQRYIEDCVVRRS